jgi:hypothetical protein
MSEFVAPAGTYALTPIACALGRLAIPEIDNSTSAQTILMLEEGLQYFEELDAPPAPHSDPEMLQLAKVFDKRLENQITDGPAKNHLSKSLSRKALQLISDHAATCANMISPGLNEILAPRDSIAEGYGMPDMWEEAPRAVAFEKRYWGTIIQHPPVDQSMAKRVNLAETRDLIKFMWQDLLQEPTEPIVNSYLTSTHDNYHLFWSPTTTGLDYATPIHYDRATQLSFDLPHNVAHLIHLNKLMGEGEDTPVYDDSMPKRAYFEAVAVLSEFIMAKKVEEDPEIVQSLTDIFSFHGFEMTQDQLKEWLLQDRAFEFKLRCVRLYADYLMLDGCDFQETVEIIHKEMQIDRATVMAEVRKYMPWTGLGAVYTLGYRKLLNENTSSISKAVCGQDGKTQTAWEIQPPVK